MAGDPSTYTRKDGLFGTELKNSAQLINQVETKVRKAIREAANTDGDSRLSAQEVQDVLGPLLEEISKDFNVELKKTNKILSDLGVTVR